MGSHRTNYTKTKLIASVRSQMPGQIMHLFVYCEQGPTICVLSFQKCIDILIEKEYLERVEGEKDMYSYLA